mgnify:CR=1 FL=1
MFKREQQNESELWRSGQDAEFARRLVERGFAVVATDQRLVFYLASALYPHNESINIWSHLAGACAFTALAADSDEVTTCSKRCNSERRRGAKLDGGDDASPALELSDVSDDDAAPALSARKLAKKAAKAERRAKRQGTASKDSGRKSCDLCDAKVNLLVRCRTDETRAWRMVCGSCWHGVSGGVPDGDAAHPHYAYGGLWKNRNPQTGESSEAERADDAAFLAAAAAGA